MKAEGPQTATELSVTKLNEKFPQEGELERFGHYKIAKVSVPFFLRPQRSYQQQGKLFQKANKQQHLAKKSEGEKGISVIIPCMLEGILLQAMGSGTRDTYSCNFASAPHIQR